jgi:hypothetical protein
MSGRPTTAFTSLFRDVRRCNCRRRRGFWWRDRLLGHLRNLALTLVIGQYAQAYHSSRRIDA